MSAAALFQNKNGGDVVLEYGERSVDTNSMAHENEGALLGRLLHASMVLYDKPWEELAPLQENIRSLSQVVDALKAKLEIGMMSPFHDLAGSISTDNAISQSPQTPAQIGTVATGVSRVRQLLTLTHDRFCSNRAQLEHLKTSANFDWFVRDARLMHLNFIQSLHQRHSTRGLDIADRLLLICSCKSVATEFSDYERRNGWPSKEDLLLMNLRQRWPLTVQKLKKNVRGFIDELRIPQREEKKLDMGLRLGIKLNVVEVIGRERGFGAFFSLLLGFELSRMIRIPYESLENLVTYLAEESEIFTAIRNLAEIYGHWWAVCQAQYAATYCDGVGEGKYLPLQVDFVANCPPSDVHESRLYKPTQRHQSEDGSARQLPNSNRATSVCPTCAATNGRRLVSWQFNEHELGIWPVLPRRCGLVQLNGG